MEEKRFMVKNFWLLHENHDNKVDEKCDVSGKGTKKGSKRLRIYTLPFIVKVLTFAP